MIRKRGIYFTIQFCLLSVLFAAMASSTDGQSGFIKGKVINYFTNDAVGFASVYWEKAGNGVITDSAGRFSLRKSRMVPDTLIVSYIGYEPMHHPFNPKKDTGEIFLTLPELKLSHTVEVKSKFNKGLRWWKSIVLHKKENDPYQFNNYSYELYNKLELDINNIKRSSFEDNRLLKPFAFILKNIDSNSEVKHFLPIYLTESISDYYYSNNPYRVREEIKAIQTNGIKNETVMQFLGGVSQKINIYENYLNFFNKEFISPVSIIGDKYYNYRGADTQTIKNQKYFHLLFFPKQAGSNTFSGDCWIHSTTWAIQKITLNISATANINFVNRLSIVQEFAQTEKGKWVFAKDKFIADLSPFSKEKISFIGRKTSTYKNVQINKPFVENILAKNKTKEQVIVNENSRSFDNAYWTNNRHEPLSLNENKVYGMIDTLKHMPLFKKYTNTVEFIFDGHKKFNKIEIGPWYKWISGNQLEKLRMRFDVGTTTQFSEHLRLNGYLAYGFKDARWKGKASFNYKLNGHESWSLSSSYTDDLDNGRIRYNDDDDATTDNLFSQLIRRQGIKQKFIGIKEWKVGLTKEWEKCFTGQISLSNSNYITYGPLPAQNNFSLKGNNLVINTELSLKLRYAPGEKQIETRYKKIKIKSNLPVIEAKYAVSLPGILKSEYSFQKITLLLNQKFRLPRWGQIDYMVYGGRYFGDSIPFMLLEIHPGNEIYYYSKHSFNLMNRFEYFSDQYIGFNIEHNFEKKLLNLVPFLRKTKIRQFWNVKTVWGDLSKADRVFNKLEFGTYRLKRLRGHNYTEIGTGIDNIFKFFRIDLVWRFAPSFVIPLTSTVPNKQQNFGIFGSFRLQF